MPGFDGTGPRGMGPMTGGGRGFCNPWGIGAAYRGYGVSPRVGYGYPSYGTPVNLPGVMPYASAMTPQQELDFLRNQAQAMRGQLEQMEARISELKTEREKR